MSRIRTGLRLSAVAIAVSVSAFGLTAYLAAAAADDGIARSVTGTEPLSIAAEDVYGGLSDADVTAAQIFLSGAQTHSGALERYDADMQRVSAGLAAIGGQADSSPVLHAALGRILADLPEYVYASGTAQADARQDLPVGAAYLREASALMRSDMLPAAQDALHVFTDRLDADDADAGSGPAPVLVLGALSFVVLCVVQIFLTRRTHRRLNPGIALTTLLAAALCVWSGSATSAASDAVSTAAAHRQAADALIATDITTLQAHGDELMTLAARGEDVGSYERDFEAAAVRLGKQLKADAGSDAADSLAAYQNWMTSHVDLLKTETAPQATNKANIDALAEVTGAGPGTGRLFGQVDADLRKALSDEESAYLNGIGAAASDLDGLANGVALAAALALAAGAYGINRRLREYR